MTEDRDIRFTPSQIAYTQNAVRARRAQLDRSIAKARAAHAAGQTIQHGTLARHERERDELLVVSEALEVARQQIARNIAQKLGREVVTRD